MIKLEIDKVKAGQAKKFEVDSACLMKARWISDIAKSRDARSHTLNASLEVSGVILPGFTGVAGDNTFSLYEWAHLPAEDVDAYRKVALTIVSAGTVERVYRFGEAYVVNYHETFESADGIGQFTILIRHKRSHIANEDNAIKLSGGYEFKDNANAEDDDAGKGRNTK